MAPSRPLAIEYDRVPLLDAGQAGGEGGFPPGWWSPVLRAQLILAEFARTAWAEVPFASTVPNDVNVARGEIGSLLGDWSLRPERQAEIFAQSADFSGAFIDLLQAGGGRRPATETLVHAAIAIGGMAALHWKWRFQRARPAQRYPAVLPLIPTPPHPSFPSGHATQANLVALLVGMALGDGDGDPGKALHPVLTALADRIGRNREIAGVHFASDTEAGKTLAEDMATFVKAQALPLLQGLMADARKEWSGVTPGDPPDAAAWVDPREVLLGDIARRVAALVPKPAEVAAEVGKLLPSGAGGGLRP